MTRGAIEGTRSATRDDKHKERITHQGRVDATAREAAVASVRIDPRDATEPRDIRDRSSRHWAITALPSSASSATEYFDSVASSSSSSPAPDKTDRSSGSRSPTRLDRFPAARFCARRSRDKSVDLAKSLGLPPFLPFFAIAASEALVAAFTWAL